MTGLFTVVRKWHNRCVRIGRLDTVSQRWHSQLVVPGGEEPLSASLPCLELQVYTMSCMCTCIRSL